MTRETPPATDEGLDISNFAGAGITFAVAVILFLLLGQWVDRKLGTSPLFLLAGVFIGGGAAFYNLYRRVTSAQKADDARRKREKDARGNE